MKRPWGNNWKPPLALRFAMIGLVLALLAVTVLVQGWRSAARSEWRRAQAELAALAGSASRIRQTKSERIACLKKLQFMNFPGQYAFSLADFVRRLSLATIPGIVYSEWRVEPEAPLYRFVLRGRLLPDKGVDRETARARLLELVDQISEFPGVGEVIAEDNLPAGPGFLHFTVSGRVEPE